MAALQDFLKQNLKGSTAANLLFVPSYVKDYKEAESKLKAIVKITADWAFWTVKALAPLRSFFLGGAAILGFKAIGDAIANIVKQTGSLDAALRRLQSIQSAQRGLAGFLGGAGAARQRVSELTVMSGRGPFSFEQIAEANKNLETFTRGAYSSAQATQKIGQAAIATGNQIGTVADAVGQFYDNLHEGRPIASSAENLRQLGIISQQTANTLVSMQTTGASNTEMFGRLSTEIDLAAASMKDMGDQIEVVNAEYQKAQENLREKFGAPWTANDVQNTKNMTVTMQAISPMVARLSEGWAQLFGGFATLRTEIVKFLATTPAVRIGFEFIAKSVTGLLTALLLVSTVGLPLLIPKLNELMLLISTKLVGANATVKLFASNWGTAIKAITAGGAIATAAAGVVMLAGAIANMTRAHRDSMRALDQQSSAFDKSNRAIKEQIANAKSLAEQQDAVAAAMNQAVDAYGNLIDVQTKLNDVQGNYFTNILDPFAIPKLILQLKELDKASAQSQEMLLKATQTFAESVRERGALTGPALSAYSEQLRQRRFISEERRFQREQELAPGRRPEIQEARGRELQRRAGLGESSAEARARLEFETSELTKQKQIHEFSAALLEKQGATQAEISAEKDKGAEVDGLMLDRQIKAQKGTAVQIEGEIKRNQLAIEAGSELEAGDKERGRQLFIQAGGQAAVTEQEREQLRTKNILLQADLATARAYENQRNQLRDQGQEYIDNAGYLRREQDVTRATADIEMKRRMAQRTGRSEEAVNLRNQEQFIQRFEELRKTFAEPEAGRRAFEEQVETIRERVPPGGLAAIGGSLARIGGGGNVYTPGGDPILQTQKQIAALSARAVEYLAFIAGKGEGVR